MAETIETKVIRLEERFTHMVSSMDDLKDLQAETNKELRDIRELIAKGKGIWWAFGAIIAVIGSTEALIHGSAAVLAKWFP